MQYHSRRLHCFCALFCLLIMLSACGTSAGSDTPSTPSPTKTSTQLAVTPTATTGQTGAAQTCPAAGSGRAAVMLSMSVGDHPNVVFLAQQDTRTLLQRYDVATDATQTILQIQQADPVLETNISPDGQWVLFGAWLQGQSAIQLVRMDGQQIQTLYCAPAQYTVGSLVLSPDQHYLVFSQVNADETENMLYLLDMRTGKLQIELSSLQPGYPVFGQYAAQSSSLSLLASPFSHRNDLSYGLPGDITKDVSQQGSNVQPVVATPETNNCQDIDVTADNRQIVCSAFTQFGPTAPSSILLQSTSGGAFHAIYRNQGGGSLNARALSNPSIIIFTLYRSSGPPILFKINSHGSGLSQMMVASTKDTLLNLAASYLPWSNASRDSTLYALQLYDLATDKQTLVYGHMSGGVPVIFASSVTALDIVGWTEL